MVLPFDNGVGGPSAPVYLKTNTENGVDDQGRPAVIHTPVVATSGGGTGTSASQVQGIQSSGTANSGNPVKIGATFLTAPPLFTDTQFGDLQMSARGMLRVAVGFDGTGGAFTTAIANNADAISPSATANTLVVSNYNRNWNGASWDRQRGDTVGTFIVDSPTGAAGQALSSIATTAVAASLVLKASAGNLYGFNVVTGASAGYLMIFDAVLAPADGSVAPKRVIAIAANTSVDRTFGKPIRFNTGITLVFSTTGPFTKTASSTAFLAGEVV